MYKHRLWGTIMSICAVVACLASSPDAFAARKSSPASVAKNVTTVKLPVRAALIRGSGDIAPVARTSFYWLKTDPSPIYISLFKARKFNDPTPTLENTDTTEKFNEFIREMEISRYIVFAEELSRTPGVKIMKTNLEGKGEISLPEGEWWVVGGYSTSFASLYWSQKINIKKGMDALELSNDNGTSDLHELMHGPATESSTENS